MNSAGMLESILVCELRYHKRSINGSAGENAVVRVRDPNFTTGYSFNWESGGVETSLHEDATPALWDGNASSIRMRKGSTLGGTVLVLSAQHAIANKVQNRP